MRRTSKGDKSPVSPRALVQRIQRVLGKRDELIRAGRGKATSELGDYYTVDLRTNALIEKDVNIEALGRELGVLKPWEKLEN
jgi:hypothetical protein